MGRPAKPLFQLVREGSFRARRHGDLLAGADLPWEAFAALQRTYRACVTEEERYRRALEFERAVKGAQRQAREQAGGNQRNTPGGAVAPGGSTKEPLPRLALSPNEAAQALGVSRDFLDEHIACELRIVRRGRRKLIPVRELERWLAEQASLALEPAR